MSLLRRVAELELELMQPFGDGMPLMRWPMDWRSRLGFWWFCFRIALTERIDPR